MRRNMSPELSERAFEDASNADCSSMAPTPAREMRRRSARRRCYNGENLVRRLPQAQARRLRPRALRTVSDAVNFLFATEPRGWKKIKQHHGAAVWVRRSFGNAICDRRSPSSSQPFRQRCSLRSYIPRSRFIIMMLLTFTQYTEYFYSVC